MSLKIYINGKYFDEDNAKISIFDHGFLYGDGVFEGIRSYNRRIFKLKEHIDRLYRSADGIMLKIPMSKKDMAQAIIDTLRSNNLDDAYIRLIITRGIGDLGLDPRKCRDSSVIIITDKIALYQEEIYKKGLKIALASTIRNAPKALDPQIKSLNYLNNILAKIEGIKEGCDEALMLTAAGYVVECTGDNIFIVKDNILFTPPADLGILKGITRDCVIDIAKKIGLDTKEEPMVKDDFLKADECFLTGTAAEVVPVVKIGQTQIGSGRPEKITLDIMERFKTLTKTEGVKY